MTHQLHQQMHQDFHQCRHESSGSQGRLASVKPLHSTSCYFGANPIERQLILSAQFLHNELPVRLAHRVAELENLPYGLSAKSPVLKAGILIIRMACKTDAFHPGLLAAYI